MPFTEAMNLGFSPRFRYPVWIGYVIAIVSVIALIIGLIALRPYLPSRNLPVPYLVFAIAALILLMTTAYLFRRYEQNVQSCILQLEESNRQTVHILERITDGFYALDRDWRLIYVNSEAFSLPHVHPDIVGKNIWEEYPELVDSVFYREYHRAVSQQKDVEFETFYEPTKQWFAVRAYPSSDGLTVYFRDITERKLAEEGLAQVAAVIDSSDDAIAIIGKTLDGTILSWNKGAEIIYGFTAEEAKGRPISILTPPDRLNEIPMILERILRGERVRHYETERIRKDGTRIHVSMSVSPVIDSSGRVSSASIIARDITDRKQAEEERERLLQEIARRENELATILSNAADAVVVADTNWNILYTNQATDRLFGRHVEVGQPLENLTNPANLREMDGTPIESSELTTVRALREGSAQERMLLLNGESGPNTVASVRSAPIQMPDGKIIGAISIVRNVTQQWLAEEALHRSEQAFKTLAENAPDIIVRLDRGLHHIYISPAFEAVTGMSSGTLIGKTCPEAGISESVCVWLDPYKEALHTGEPVDAQFEFHTPDGPRSYQLRVVPEKGNNGQFESAMGIGRDITDLVAARQAVEQQKAFLEAIASNIPIGFVFLDRAFRYTFVNPAASKMTGIPAEKWIGKHPGEVLPSAEIEPLVIAAKTAFFDGKSVELHDYQFFMDKEHYFDIECLPVRNSEGEIIGVGAVAVETTAKVEVRKGLERSYDREHHIAEILQSTLLTPVPNQINGFRFESIYRAAWEEARVGGDFFDVFPIGEDKIQIVIGDVSGKGLEAAAQVALVKYSIRSRAYDLNSPSAVLEKVSKTLAMDKDTERFATIFLGVLDSSRKTLTYASAGHSPVILWRQSESQTELLELTGPVAGIEPTTTYHDVTIKLNPGDELLLGTDGLYEVHCESRMLEIDGLLKMYSDMKDSGVASAHKLVERVMKFCENQLQDDIAVLRVSVLK